ncbi:cytochrome P450 3A6-like [Lytechinus variegatus]|uniref:cytochrome P450 3A6-like n=1 Tax=Lytechinus variegatus TaxID=7654 RepID=UPI001BB1F494|nr:cytochrome P450 3A6-like [Lytechinus variegatus]
MGFLSLLSGFVSMTTLYLVVVLIVIFFAYDFWTHTYFKRRGIPGPPPKPIFGNALDFSRPSCEVLEEYGKRYGTIFGVYLWRKPIIVIADVDVLRNVMIKDYHRFYNKYPMPMKSGVFDLALFQLRDSQWKRIRDIMTPTFTGKKMKMMSDTINSCADTMVEKLRQSCEKDGNIDTVELFGSFIMDNVASCGFGLKVNSQKDKADPFVEHVSRFFKVSFTSPAFMAVSFMPVLKHVFRFLNITLFPKDVIDFFSDVTEKAVALRENNPMEKGADFLQLLIDAKNGQDETANENDDDDIHNKYFKNAGPDDDLPSKTQKYITREEMLGQSIIFIAAGYETTSALLTMSSYLLATNPDHQDKLIAEVDEVAPKRDDVSYSTISKMPYLDQVICEALRIYPPATLTDRQCGETCVYNGFTIEKGSHIWIPPYSIHRDPDHWPNPTKFDPDRFTKENREGRNPFTWIPFGAGPRICIGMRFAMMEAKMALVRSLQVVRFEVSPLTKIPPDVGPATILNPNDSYVLKVVQRY